MAGVLTDAFGAPPDHGLLELASGAAGNPSLLAELIQGLRDEDAVQRHRRLCPAGLGSASAAD